MCDELGLPRCVLMTKLDRERADSQRVLDEVREKLSTRRWPLQLPIGQETSFAGVVESHVHEGAALRNDGRT